jgi:hypothetical protein
MATKSTLGTQVGKFVFVSGINGGREVFLGRPIDEPYADTLTIEGKSISFTPQGQMVVKPFATLCTFPTKNSNCQIQQIQNPEALHEANNLFNTSATTLTRASYPLTFRWIESSMNWLTNGVYFNGGLNTNGAARALTTGYNAFVNPFSSFFEGFKSSAEQFRRALFQSPQVSSSREMDKLTELEGDLVIEIGKITNQVAVKFNQFVGRNTELGHYFESMQGYAIPLPTPTTMGGWCFLMNRLQIAKNWARRNGKTPLVREINTLTKEGINGLNEIILEHCSSLDTLITETFSQYGITFELHGEMSPFASYTTPYSGTIETYDATNTPLYAGAGI